ncbi:MAG TPA: S-methyl-5-thioribose-1-phosphate isomerase [Bryobacterales bacterium]|nr:S-methyl-5-thioribose-1-phosphate isomerase [Bryobacterales bacterium]
MVETIRWTPEGVVMVDQRVLPLREEYVTCRSADEVGRAIRDMVIRGAPAIGVAAAMGVALAFQRFRGGDPLAVFEQAARALNTRPTAVNLKWALDRMRRLLEQIRDRPAAEIRDRLAREAQRIKEEDIATNRAIGRYGAPLVPDGKAVLTHCTAGALATAGYGTALGVVRAAVEAGKRIEVFADETRPFLQGARLTAWELIHDGIPTTVITDGMAGHFLRTGRIGCVVVGADRIAANGDVANKIGTYSVAVLAKESGVPFYVAAPVSTLDLSLASGDEIPIEQRDPSEVTHIGGVRIVPEGARVENPAFDVTPHRYVTAIITERGVARPPFEESLRAVAGAAAAMEGAD